MAIDLFCGLSGWADGFLMEGYDVIGFDIERHRYPKRDLTVGDATKGMSGANQNGTTHMNYENEQRIRNAPLTGGWDEYPGQLVLQDILTLHGAQFKDAAVIVASPPCQAYSYRAMPWKRAKALPPPSNDLFDACFRIQREASEAAGHHIPLVVENVKGAQPWVGRAKWHYGSFYLWGDVPALMPPAFGRKVPGFNFHEHEKTGKPGGSFQSAAVKNGNDWFGSGADCSLQRRASSGSSARKAVSAQIAKIPEPLARHIARVFKP